MTVLGQIKTFLSRSRGVNNFLHHKYTSHEDLYGLIITGYILKNCGLRIDRMSLLTLPTEVLTIIVRKLDIRAVYDLYQSCKYFRDLIRMPGVIQSCQLSMSTLATVRSFNLTLFRDISGHIRTLNLSGINDLHRSSLMPILNKLKNLIDLDVSFTKITIPDYLVIIKAVPTLKSLAINFSFVGNHKLDTNSLLQYQQAFEGLKNIHFFGRSAHLVDNKLAVCLLQKAHLSTVKFTICKHHSIVCGHLEVFYCDDTIQMNMSHLQICYMGELFDSPLNESRLFSLMDLSKYEMLMFQTCFSKTVFATPLIGEFIRKNFEVMVDKLTNSKGMIGAAAIMFWDKERTEFNSEFYGKLLRILREYLIFSFEFTEKSPVPSNYKRYWVEQYTPGLEEFDSVIHFDEETLIKRARLRDSLSGKAFALNYDEAFKEKKCNFRLEVCFLPISRPVSLHHRQFLKMLSHLILHHGGRFTPTFFKVLFESCTSLVTLEIIRRRGIVASPLKLISRSKSLKNVLLFIRGSYLEPIYEYLSECRTLENIHLVDTSYCSSYESSDPLPDPTQLFTRCDRLYNFCYQSYMSEPERAEELEDYKDIRTELGKHGLNIDMSPYSDSNTDYRYTPYIGVFDVFQCKPMLFNY